MIQRASNFFFTNNIIFKMISQFLFSLWVAVQTSIQQSEFKNFLFILKLQKFKNQRLNKIILSFRFILYDQTLIHYHETSEHRLAIVVFDCKIRSRYGKKTKKNQSFIDPKQKKKRIRMVLNGGWQKIHVTRVENTWFGMVLNGHIFYV